MADPFPIPDNLDSILDDIWIRWGRGSVDRRSAFHTPMVASVDADGAPDQRVMVLRKADRDTGVLRFHTDIRSTKAAQFGATPVASVVGYDAGAKIQLRARGTADLVATGPIADSAWATTSASGRRSYMTTLAPGSISSDAASGLPTSLETMVPSPDESETARVNFAIVPITLDRLEWLHLASKGHRRAAFTRIGNDWTGQWLVP